jgi:predicted small secreted protein
MTKTIKSISIVICMSFCLTACSTMSAAYDSVSDTVGGWFKSDDAKK